MTHVAVVLAALDENCDGKVSWAELEGRRSAKKLLSRIRSRSTCATMRSTCARSSTE